MTDAPNIAREARLKRDRVRTDTEVDKQLPELIPNLNAGDVLHPPEGDVLIGERWLGLSEQARGLDKWIAAG